MAFSPEQMPILSLNSGQQIPQLGLGVYKMTQDIAIPAIRSALDLGYRRIDTAALYDNEVEVGAAIRQSGIARHELFVTTKVWHDHQGYDDALEAIDESLDRLNIDYIDMVLIHWPAPKLDKYVDTWKAFEHALSKGRIKGIGVSNFEPDYLERIIGMAEVVPAINQVELHPGFQQKEVRAFDTEHGIRTEAWSPINRNRYDEHPTLQALSKKYGKSTSQIIIRWHIELGNLVIPKSVTPNRQAENLDVFDFSLDADDHHAIAAMDEGNRTGPNPREFN
ncbi:MAG: aldo/keto reductase [Micrococcales bacterium]